MGSNMAENHPVGFQWVMEAKARGATVFHADPRFTRTSAMADRYVPLRAGSDIAFLGGIVHYILEHERWFDEYVKAYTNAPVLIKDGYADTEDLDGFFCGWDAEKGAYDSTAWEYAGTSMKSAAGQRSQGGVRGNQAGHGGAAGDFASGDAPELDETLQDPRCVFQLLRKHYQRYTPEMVEQVCGTPKADFERLCEALCDASGRERTGAFVYAVGLTQHTTGVQTIRTAAIMQLLLGNIGRPGGGIMAMRGHASIQGSTDIPTLYDILPGYLPMPHAAAHDVLADYVETNAAPNGFWGNMDRYIVSLLKAYWGEHATAENDYAFGYLPRITGDHSVYQTMLDALDGKVRGYFILGENPAVGSANGKLHRRAMANLEWLVVRDFSLIESATFWKDGPEVETGEMAPDAIATEVFFLPAAAHTEKEGTFTNTQRMLQWRDKAVEPTGDQRSELWFAYHLGRRIRDKLAASTEARDEPIQRLTWDYPTSGPLDEPDAAAVLREINGWNAQHDPLASFTDLAADGSTACGCWIYCGVYKDGVNQAARRKPHWEQNRFALEWAWAWPANRRLLYNRASADPEGHPWSERKKLTWWDDAQGKWVGDDVPDFELTKPPSYRPAPDARAQDAIAGDKPFVMQADGRGWIFAPAGIIDGPLPTHYEPHESPVRNPLYGQATNPTRQQYQRPENPYNPSRGAPGASSYPYVVTSYRLTEHHTAGAMTRTLPYLSELQPELFCEVSPALAAERRLRHGEWATIITARAAIEARVMVTDRIAPLQVDGRTSHVVALPYHWGYEGLSKGDAVNDLFALALDANVHIQEVKAASCDIRPGRRPRGAARPALVDSYPRTEAREGREAQ